MNFSIIFFQLSGFFLSSLFQFFLFLLSYKISSKYWAYYYCMILLSTSSILCIKSLGSFPYIEHIVCATYLLLFIKLFSFEKFKFILRSIANFSKKIKVFQYFVLIAILLQCLYAAYPAYRPDQWDYHLTIPKIIHSQGSLNIPIFNDHIFFSGIYEYFFLIPRIFISNDTLIQSFTNTFSLQILLLTLLYLSVFWANKLKNTNNEIILILGFLIFSLPSQNMIMNAKIEPLLLGISCLLLNIIFDLRKNYSHHKVFLIGFLLSAPLAGKIIWIQFLISFFLVFSLSLLLEKKFVFLKSYIAGLILGLCLSIPFLLKNFTFFGNPFHPVQAGIFKSIRWDSKMHNYWLEVSKRAQDLNDYFYILFNAPLSFSWNIKYVLIGLFLCFGIKSKSLFWKNNAWFFKKISLMLIISFIIWPFFFDSQIFPRFYFPLISLAIIPVIIIASYSVLNSFTIFILLIPIMFNSSLETKSMQMVKNFCKPLDSFYSEGKAPLFERTDIQIINTHRRMNFPSSPMDQAVVLADIPRAYFSDSLFIYFDGMDYNWHKNDIKKRLEQKPCIWFLLKTLKINYLYSKDRSLISWGSEFTEVIKQSVSLSPSENIFYMSPKIIDYHLQSCKL